MTDLPNKPTPFWTFSARDIKFGVSGLRVKGWFIWCLVDNVSPEGEPEHLGLKVHYLTPFDAPLTLDIPRSLLNKPLDTVTARDLVSALTTVFGDNPFQAVPAAPSDLPLHRIPPSRRAAIKAAILKRQV